jgi:transcriptional regulator with XRE-family HTH domain
MSVITGLKNIKTVIKDIMKYDETPLLPPAAVADSLALGGKLARLRKARRLRQQDAALRAGVSRSTAALIEKGDPGRTLAQVLRYLNAIAPGTTLLDLLLDKDPALRTLAQAEATQRVRSLSGAELQQLDF